MLLDTLSSSPASIHVVDEDGMHPLTSSAIESGVWGNGSLRVEVKQSTSADHIVVRVSAPATPIRQVHITWAANLRGNLRFLGDHWERAYGDLEWRGMVPERKMPWYFLLHDGKSTDGAGVETSANAFCWWQVNSDGIALSLDASNGARGTHLGDRVLELATVRTLRGTPNMSPMQAAIALCRRLCPAPRLPSHPVYGANDWYYAYGNSTAATILRDTDILVSLSPTEVNRPYMVIDAGWQARCLDADTPSFCGAPWDRGNANFPDIGGLASEIAARHARPGIWIRPLAAEPNTGANLLLPVVRARDATAKIPILDPSIDQNLMTIETDFARLNKMGYELIKHDWTTCDILGRWGFEMDAPTFTNDNWHFADTSRTTVEIIRALYSAIRRGAAHSTIIGCNTIGHIAAGLFELQRTGDDTSGIEWERTRKMGINTLAHRMAQHETFFVADADCVGLTNAVPWPLNRQWLDLLGRSGTPLFVSASPEVISLEHRSALRDAYHRAAHPQPIAEPLDWLDTTCPTAWRFGDDIVRYRWFD